MGNRQLTQELVLLWDAGAANSGLLYCDAVPVPGLDSSEQSKGLEGKQIKVYSYRLKFIKLVNKQELFNDRIMVRRMTLKCR